ncbi:hypothetical protein CXG81DRAFT_10399 [Caulochytrium protostelioides]|uniref:Peroxisomal hydratase-dehydrogenase-epimerase n=1 Tax=Caulochytrium protostelioides TaxID=1555241 RepID=A0A4P9XBH3_9FUNG|nr:hypothetical protein CXG81DRAFT_10399 [Caulochytrium protostelioides]|eukprot:RKP02725.1 hypothetical protein CXG81DRAFT_10399 [Caulochytrium protostelioides]
MRFDGRTVIVTGAGGGLGKAYALWYASRGANVVVNDLGIARTGEGGADHKAADVVVREIQAAGGKAVANYDSVENGEAIVATALQAFGAVHIIINNAGILRDVSFARMSDADWDLVHAVHVRGAYRVTHAAWPHMLKQGYGRVINTASAAGIYGNFGQANYASAKLALHGLTMALAREGERKNVLVNTIAPVAASRMTETVLPPEILANMKPDFIVPLVGYLTHESVKENGSIFECGAGWVSQLRRQRGEGAVFKADPSFTAATVATKFPEIMDYDRKPQYPASIMETDWVGLLETARGMAANPPAAAGITLQGKVALVTGAGAGLGRAHALTLAKMGAKVVVNDLGVSHTGQGTSSRAADAVVAEIKAMGGEAVANYDSVEHGDKLVATALQAFGGIHIVVNNAGILRDKSFARMSDADWDLVYNIHLRGTYKVLKAAWPHMLKQQYGRIINTTSAVGIYGNFGQANYAAAKAGIIALSNSLAQEGGRKNILVNTIAPNAGTRMTATIMPPDMVEALKPEYISPLVGFLASEKCPATGQLFEVGSGWMAPVRWQRTQGVGFPINRALTPEAIAARWSDVTNFGRATFPTNAQESFGAVQANFDNKASSPSPPSSSDPEPVRLAKSQKMDKHEYVYTHRESILYNLGIGAKREELPLVYENDEHFAVVPTFGVIPAFGLMMAGVRFDQFLPDFNPMMLLHGEQYLELKRPLPTSGKLSTEGRIIEMLDKGKAASVVIATKTYDEQGQLLCENQFTNFIRGAGGFGGSKGRDRGAATALNQPPSRPADKIVREKTTAEQAALYRLSGDWNPLHIDPSMSAAGGFEVPILHGLCSFGIAGKHVFQAFCHNDPARFKSIKVRFAKHVFPGETLETHMWKEGNKVVFIVKVVERDAVVISNAAVELHPSATATSGSDAPASASGNFASTTVFQGIRDGLDAASDRAGLVKKTGGLIAFEITNDAGQTLHYTVDMKNGAGAVYEGAPKNGAKPDLAISVSDANFGLLAAGKLSPQKAFMSRKIKVKGNLMLANKLDAIMKLAKPSARM